MIRIISIIFTEWESVNFLRVKVQIRAEAQRTEEIYVYVCKLYKRATLAVYTLQ